MNNYSQFAQLPERAKTVLACGASSEFRKYSYPHALFYSHGKGKGLIRSVQHLLVQGHGTMFVRAFTPLKLVREDRNTLTFNAGKMRKLAGAMRDEGIRIIGRGLWYISPAHTQDDGDQVVNRAQKVLEKM